MIKDTLLIFPKLRGNWTGNQKLLSKKVCKKRLHGIKIMKVGGKISKAGNIKIITKGTMGNKKILLGLTTTPASDWRDKIKEIRKLNITEISIFPTYLKSDERKELYKLLENSPIKNIPHVHLRSDMDLQELDYFVENCNTKVFNIHSENTVHALKKDFSKYSSIIYIENTEVIPTEEELKKYAGLCIDFSHWEDFILLKNPNYFGFLEKISKFETGCGHISGIKKETITDPDPDYKARLSYACHTIQDFNELDYIKKYLQYLPDIISIELENSFEEQLRVKEYLEKIINRN